MSDTVVATAADPFLGRTIANRFELVSVLGEGGMGKVYTAKDRETGQLAAVKVIIGKLSGNEEYVARLRQEARTAGRLRHEAAVRIIAHGETEQGEPYLAMEYCPGRSLKEVVAKEKHLEIARACNIISQILGAVGAAHRQGIVHRDLKPENIKIAPDPLRGEGVKVLDFGVAKFVGGEGVPEMENAVKTKTGIILGTPKYMAPEQIRGEQVDGRSDIYSCGAILYELLSGTPPFQADDVFGYVTKHLKEPVMPLADRCPEFQIPKELDDLVMWMLEKNPVQRPKDSQQVNEILDKFAKGSSSARMKFLAKVGACWVLPGAAAAFAIAALIPDSVKVAVEEKDSIQEMRKVTLDYGLTLLRAHGVALALGLGIAGTLGIVLQPRLSVAAYIRRLAVVGILLFLAQGAALAFGGAPWAMGTYAMASILMFVAFSLSWPMDRPVMRLLWTGIVAPVAAVLMNPVPLVRGVVENQPVPADATEFFLRINHGDLWKGAGLLQNLGVLAALTILLPGILIGIGTVFLPKPGRGSAG